MAREFGLDPDVVADTKPLAKLFAWQAWAIENNPWGEVVRDTDGYIAQEVTERLK